MAVRKKNWATKQEIYEPKDVAIPRRLGGGKLKERVVRELPSKKVVEYALAYINPLIFNGDNGRVLGYDNSHNYSHKHLMVGDYSGSFPRLRRVVRAIRARVAINRD